MSGTPVRRLLPVCLAVLTWAGVPSRVAACEFCSMQGQTFTDEVNQATMVLFGTLTNAKLDPVEASAGTTDLNIEAVIKKHDILGDQKVLPLPRYLPNDGSVKFLIFCDVFKGKVDPYRGVPVKRDSDMVKYLNGALAVKNDKISDRLQFFFKFLNDPDIEISNDAYKAFGNASYKDYQEMAKTIPADKAEEIAKWLQDPETPASRYGLYASMLGHCGNDKHAELLHKMLDEAQKQLPSGVDGMLAGYTLLKPADGWAYLRGILNDPSKEFGLRFAALRAARFFWTSRPDVVDKKKIVEGVGLLLDDPTIADLAIEDLRKWNCWEMKDRVLGLYGKPSHDVPILRRAILKYALSCPGDPAATFVADLRKKDPDLVSDTEEWLKLETNTQAPKPVANK